MSTRNLKDGLQSGRTSALTSTDARAETVEIRRGNAVAGMASRTDATVRAPRIVDTLATAGVLEQLSTQPPPIAAVGTDPSKPALDACLPGRRLDQYEVVRQIGRGGMGTVYLARDLRLGRLVAIKVLSRLGVQDSARFLTEARVTARCNHENIVMIYDVGEHDGQPYMVFEYVAGQTLSAWLDDRTRRSGGSAPPIAVTTRVPSGLNAALHTTP